MTVADSIVTAPTNGHIYAVLGNTQTVTQKMLKLDSGTSARNHILLYLNSTASFAGDVHLRSYSSVTQATIDSRGIF